MRPGLPRGVIVAHPGTQHSYETAFGLQQAGLLQEYITGLYFKEGRGIGRVLPMLPERIRSRALRELAKRRRAGLDERLVRTYPAPEWAYLAAARAPLPAWLPGSVMRLRNRIFGQLVARRVWSASPDAILCYDSCALAPFRAAKTGGAVRILDQTVCHLTTSIPIITEEQAAGRSGGGAGTPPKWLIEQCTEEARQADLVLAGSGFVRESLLKIGVAREGIAILPYGADVKLFAPPPAERRNEPLTAVYAGQLSPRKGIAYLLEAFARLRSLRCKLLLIGGSAREAESLLARYGGVFEHVPSVPRTELAACLRRADFFVYPSLLDGSALVTYEALASGLPVITTPNSGSVVRDGVEGFIVPPRDVDALRGRIEQLVRDEDLRRSMGIAARHRAEEFSWANYHKRLATLVRSKLETRGSQLASKSAISGCDPPEPSAALTVPQ